MGGDLKDPKTQTSCSEARRIGQLKAHSGAADRAPATPTRHLSAIGKLPPVQPAMVLLQLVRAHQTKQEVKAWEDALEKN